MRPFQVLLGPNGSGKSTLVDALAFLCDLQRTSVEGAVWSRLMSFGQDGYSLAYLHPELLELRNPDNVIRRRWGDGKRAVLPSYADETDVPLALWFADCSPHCRASVSPGKRCGVRILRAR